MNVRRLLMLGIGAIALTACGAATSKQLDVGAPASTPGPATSGAVATLGATATASLPARITPMPAPVRMPHVPVSSGNGRIEIVGLDGTATATLPSGTPYQPVSLMGDGLLTEHRIAGAQGTGAVDHLDDVTPTGGTQRLWTFKPGTQVLGAIARADGSAYAFIIKGSEAGCGTSSAGPPAELWVGSAPNEARRVAVLPVLPNDDPWVPYAWSKAGIVLAQGAGGGCMGDHLPINDRATDLVNPVTGAVTPLVNLLGKDCPLQDIADDGTMLCLIKGSGALGTGGGVRIIGAGGGHRDVALPTSCRGGSFAMVGAVSISPDGSEATLSTLCFADPSASGSVQGYLLDVAGGRLTALPAQRYGLGWVDDDHLLVTNWLRSYPDVSTVAVSDRRGNLTTLGSGTLFPGAMQPEEY